MTVHAERAPLALLSLGASPFASRLFVPHDLAAQGEGRLMTRFANQAFG